MARKLRRLVGNQRGQELLEFAIVLPFLALLLAGVIEFGRAFYEYNILTKSVRDAARYVSAVRINSDGTFPAPTNLPPLTIPVRAQNLATYGNISGTGTPILPGLLTITITPHVAAPGEIYVTVSAEYTFQSLFSFLLRGAKFRPKETMMCVGPIVYPTK